jgi:DNA-directed RNA polymerase subunit omega
MARITVEDCLQKVNNRFTVIHMASQRVRQLRKGSEPTITSKNRDVVISLREIASGNVKQADLTHQAYLPDGQEENFLNEPSEATAKEMEENPVEPDSKEIDTEGDS